MSYRLVSKAATFSSNGIVRLVDLRAYALPKRIVVGKDADVNGVLTNFSLTAGRGRGLSVNRYAYTVFRGTEVFFPLDQEAFDSAFRHGFVLVSTDYAVVEAAAEPAAETMEVVEPVVEPVVEVVVEVVAEPVKKATRRSKKAVAA